MKEMILALSSYLNWFKLPVKDERGQGLVEYALIIALMSITLVAALTALSGGVGSVFSDIVGDL